MFIYKTTLHHQSNYSNGLSCHMHDFIIFVVHLTAAKRSFGTLPRFNCTKLHTGTVLVIVTGVFCLYTYSDQYIRYGVNYWQCNNYISLNTFKTSACVLFPLSVWQKMWAWEGCSFPYRYHLDFTDTLCKIVYLHVTSSNQSKDGIYIETEIYICIIFSSLCC